MIRKRRIVLGLLVAIVLAACGVGYWQRDQLLSWHHARQLRAATAEQRQVYVTKFERLGRAGASALVSMFRDVDELACRNAAFVLTKLLSSRGSNHAGREAILNALVDSVGHFSPCGQAECVGLLQQLLAEQPEPAPAMVSVLTRLLGQVGSNPEARQAALELTADLLRHEGVTAEALVSQAKAWVVAGLRETSPQVRAAAVRLAVVPAVRAHDMLPSLVVGKADPSPEVRQLVLLALGEHESLLGTDDLCKYLHDESPQVRTVCERALRARGLTSEQITLAKLANDPRPASRAEVPALILRTPELDTVLWMERLTRDSAPAVRAAAARAMGNESDQRLRAFVRQLADGDTDPTVQEIARFYLNTGPKDQ